MKNYYTYITLITETRKNPVVLLNTVVNYNKRNEYSFFITEKIENVFSVKRTYLNRCLFITSTIIINRYLLNYSIQLSSNYSTLLYSLLMLKQKKTYIKGQKTG